MAVTVGGEPDVAVRARLRRIEGQTAALVRMCDDGRSSLELLDQIAAVRAALGAVGLAVVARDLAGRQPAGDDGAQGADGVELLALIHRLVRCT